MNRDGRRAAGVASKDDVMLARSRGERWLPSPRVSTVEEAARFIDDVGFAVLFPADRVAVPSLFEAIADPDAVAWEHGMGVAESIVWTWKDALPAAEYAWSGKLVYRRASLVSPALLTSLYQGQGDLDDHRGFELPSDSRRISEALLHGPLPSSALRELVGDRKRYSQAMAELHRNLLVTSAGIVEQRGGWPATLVDLTCRVFDVGGGGDRLAATRRFIATVIEATPAGLAKSFGWPLNVAKAKLAELEATGEARLTPAGNHRLAESSSADTVDR